MPFSRLRGRVRTGMVFVAGLLLLCGTWAPSLSGALAPSARVDQQRGATPPATPPATAPAQQTPAAGRVQSPSGPGQRGREFLWWNDEGVKKDLGLTAAQVKRITDIYEKRLDEIKPFSDELSKQVEELNRMVRERQVNDTDIMLQARRVEALRAPVNESRILMLYRMSRVLTAAQSDQLPGVLDKHRPGRGGH
jgi:Spy/CpxP family protein refolding chaperone